MSKNLGEIIVSIVFVLLLLVKLDPFKWTMPDEIQMIVLALVIAAYGLYAGLLFREKPEDERDTLHIHKANRAGYLFGIAILVIGIAIQSFQKSLDPWLVVVLASMIIVKLIIRLWLRNRN